MAVSMGPRIRLSGSAACLLLVIAAADGASAQRYHRNYDYADSYVIAESRHGKGSVEGAVRLGRKGHQVQMPGGTWIDCERNCSETLRRATVDFWESNGPQSKDQGPGYFRWSFGRW